MAELSDRLALPLLSAGRAQKELSHKEALAILDLIGHAAVEDHGINTPPSTPSAGQCWIVGASPTGAWAGHANALAGWTGGGWRFVAPRPGMVVWDIGAGYSLHHDGSGWVDGALSVSSLNIGAIQVVGSQSAAIPAPTGGSVVDVEARAAMAMILDALRTHGLIAT